MQGGRMRNLFEPGTVQEAMRRKARSKPTSQAAAGEDGQLCWRALSD